jgi:hypothetical protein
MTQFINPSTTLCKCVEKTIHHGKQVENMLRDDVIEPSKGPFTAPVVLVGKSDGNKWQFCGDYR